MNSTIERGPYGSRFCLLFPTESVEIAYQMELLMSERPEILLPIYRHMTAQGPSYSYPITGLRSLSELVANKQLNIRRSGKLLHLLKADLQSLPDHLLSAEQVLLHPDAIFLNSNKTRFQLVYQPILPVMAHYDEGQLMIWLGERLCHNCFQRLYWEKHVLSHKQIENEQNSPIVPAISAKPIAESKAESVDLKENCPFRDHMLARILVLIQIVALIFTILSYVFHSQLATVFAKLRVMMLITFLLSIPAHFLLTMSADNLVVPKLIATFHRLNPLPLFCKLRTAIMRRAEKSDANLNRIRELPTELLSSRQETFRLATLSEGMIGTTAETAGQRVFILTEEYVIGRDYRLVDLCLSGYAVGRRHALITRKGATFFITDLGSKNGTRLNGECLHKLIEYRLPDHCSLHFADRLFYFEAEELIDQSQSLNERVDVLC